MSKFDGIHQLVASNNQLLDCKLMELAVLLHEQDAQITKEVSSVLKESAVDVSDEEFMAQIKGISELYGKKIGLLLQHTPFKTYQVAQWAKGQYLPYISTRSHILHMISDVLHTVEISVEKYREVFDSCLTSLTPAAKFNVVTDEGTMDISFSTPLEKIFPNSTNVSARALKALRENGITLLGELLTLKDEEVGDLDGFGVMCTTLTKEFAANLGLSFGLEDEVYLESRHVRYYSRYQYRQKSSSLDEMSKISKSLVEHLHENGIHYIGQIAQLEKESFLKLFSSLEEQNLTSIEDALADRGLRFGMKLAEPDDV